MPNTSEDLLRELVYLLPTNFNYTESVDECDNVTGLYRACVGNSGVIHINPDEPLDWRIAGWCLEQMQISWNIYEKQVPAMPLPEFLLVLRDFFCGIRLAKLNQEAILQAYVAFKESQKEAKNETQ